MSTARPLILLLIDGLSSKAAQHMGCLEGLVRSGAGMRVHLASELPPISKPLYRCIFTGQEPAHSGLLNNQAPLPPRDPDNFFAICAGRGIATAAASHRWFADLFASWDVDLKGRFQEEPSGDIRWGIYYFDDSYPDSHVLGDAEHLLNRHRPGFMLVHTMGVDHAAHSSGTSSTGFISAVMGIDQLASGFIFRWTRRGYAVLVTSDHGALETGLHGGTSDEETQLPLWAFPTPQGSLADALKGITRQRQMKDLMLEFIRGYRP